ncbi:hypothetical protein BH11ACT1_BH11ACT1_02930 [soil metagenome]
MATFGQAADEHGSRQHVSGMHWGARGQDALDRHTGLCPIVFCAAAGRSVSGVLRDLCEESGKGGRLVDPHEVAGVENELEPSVRNGGGNLTSGGHGGEVVVSHAKSTG